MKYRANTLVDIADHFEGMAANCETKREALMGNRSHETKDAAKLAEAAAVWRAAADLIRNTELEGVC